MLFLNESRSVLQNQTNSGNFNTMPVISGISEHLFEKQNILLKLNLLSLQNFNFNTKICTEGFALIKLTI